MYEYNCPIDRVIADEINYKTGIKIAIVEDLIAQIDPLPLLLSCSCLRMPFS